MTTLNPQSMAAVADQAARIDGTQLDTLATLAVQRAQSARELSLAQARQVSGGATTQLLLKPIIAGGKLIRTNLATTLNPTITLNPATNLTLDAGALNVQTLG